MPTNQTSLIQAACLLYIRQDGMLAVVSRRNKATIGLIGGKVDPGETFQEAASRESNEEAGVVTHPDDLIELHVSVCEAEDAQSKPSFCKAFLHVAPDDAVLSIKEPGIVPKWVTFDTLLKEGAFTAYNQRVLDAYREYVTLHAATVTP